MHAVVIYYLIYSLVIAAIGIILAWRCFYKTLRGSRFLGLAIFSGVIVDLCYLLSIVSTDYFFSSLMSSLYFSFIDVMLLGLLGFAWYYTKRTEMTEPFHSFYGFFWAYGCLDMTILMVNPFREIAISYTKRDTPIAHYAYVRMPPYNMHLLFSYVLVVFVLVILIRKMLSVPAEYQNQFFFILLGILMTIGINAIFLYIPDKGVVSLIDVSICLYAVVEMIIYWACYQYATHGMLNHFKNVIFENIGQGLVLFDYEDILILANERARQLVPSVDYEKPVTFEQFAETCGISWDWEGHGVHSLQCYPGNRALRCDCSIIRDKHDRPLGRLFVFTDTQEDTDPLTGFENFEHFRSFANENKDNFPYPTTAVVFDINSLAVINSRFGRDQGDLKIRSLADKMRSIFPKDTYFVRGSDAHLIAICYQETEERVHTRIGDEGSLGEDIQYAAACNKDEDIVSAVLTASAALRNKKLVNRSSSHSELISSLVRALQECDPETSDHVRRTQMMGQRLADRLHLPDIARTQLSLLCLMHDIGKIGIPLEILNKPGKLNAQEWAIMQSHVQKGYQIAKSSDELSGIADMILHHHERWDGKGYPDGLSRESIPVLSRIICIIDAFDAMTNDRVYRKAMSRAEAAEELRRCAGTQFDPRITSEFLQLVREDMEKEAGETIQQSFKEQTTENEPAPVPDAQPGSITQNSLHPLETAACITSANLDILFVNDVFTSLTGYSREELCGEENVNFSILVPEAKRTAFLLTANQVAAGKEPVMAECHMQKKDGTDLFVLISFREFFDSANKSQNYEIMVTNLGDTYMKKMVELQEADKASVRLNRWEQQFRRDSLTKLLTHEAFISDLEDAILSGDYHILMFMFDVDDFKQINDTQGHTAGDNVLIKVANALSSSVRASDLAGRLGGDEFALALLFEITIGGNIIRNKARNLYDSVSGKIAESFPGVTLSAGAVISMDGDETSSALYDRADRALYASKKGGKGRLTMQ